ncbi:hypothetical protein [Xanthomonas phage NED111]|uniref:Uncharacterized protein n=3 Tax=Pradovirus TaxID=1985733 RepID=A0A5B9N7R5_9CAUD|nr:hypothetical protein CPT_Pagan_016 [Xanthomonas phage Pagan]QGH45044.1 hypothetical protein [Bacteriophage Titan-X]UZV39743.1 hypothetical protein [Xanthomonas phage NED111]
MSLSSPAPVSASVKRGDELKPGTTAYLIDTRQTNKLTKGTPFVVSKLTSESGDRLIVSTDGNGSVLYATDNDIFEVFE